MKTNVNVIAKANGLFRIEYRGKTISDNIPSEQQAHLQAHHFTHAPSLAKRLNLKKVDGILKGRPFWGVEVAITKIENEWMVAAHIDGKPEGRWFKTRQAALSWVASLGKEMLTTRNILNPEAGDIQIARSAKGGCTDPGTERYHSM